MNQYDVGDKVKITANFTDENGIAADPDAPVCRVKAPDGTSTSWTYPADAEIVRDDVGSYHLDVSIDQSGTWFYRWEGSGTFAAAEEGAFSVRRSRF